MKNDGLIDRIVDETKIPLLVIGIATAIGGYSMLPRIDAEAKRKTGIVLGIAVASNVVVPYAFYGGLVAYERLTRTRDLEQEKNCDQRRSD